MNNILFLLIFSAAISCVAQEDRTLINLADGIALQLVEYKWQPLTNNAVHPLVISNVFEWSKTTLNDNWSPPLTSTLSIHHREKGTCDAVKLEYQKAGYRISIAQAVWPLVVVIEGSETTASSTEEAEALANRIMVKCMRYGNRFQCVQCVTKKQGKHFWLGCLKKPDSVASEGIDDNHFDPWAWWTDGKRISYYGLRFPRGADKPDFPAIISPAIEFNQVWFDRYQGKRAGFGR